MIRALPSGELRAGEAGDTDLRRVEVDGEDVLLARLADGQVVAFAGFCPHQMTDLGDATIWDGKVRCPRHNYLYDPCDGANILPTRDAKPENLWKLLPGYLPCYRVEERDGWIWVDPEPLPAPESYDPALEEPPAVTSRTRSSPSGPAPTGSQTPSVSPTVPTLVIPPTASVGLVEHAHETLSLASSSTVELRLPTTPRPGFMWKVEASAPLLAVVEERFEPGDPPVHRVKLAAGAGTGEGTVRCSYARPWDREPAEVRTYVVTVTASGDA